MKCKMHNIEVTNCSRQMDCKNCEPPDKQPELTPKTIEKWVKVHKLIVPPPVFDQWDRGIWSELPHAKAVKLPDS
jgi:hypothetical protein